MPQMDITWLASDNKNSQFIAWSDLEMSCSPIQSKDDNIINVCESNGVILSINKIGCLAGLFLHGQSDNSTCTSTLMKTPRTWLVQMEAPNRWLITVGAPTKISTNCFNYDDVSVMTISGTGILNVLEPCDVTIDGRTIIFKNKFESKGPSLTLVQSTGSIPQMPQWDIKFIEDNVNKQPMDKVVINSHSDLTKVIQNAISETANLERAWENENIVRQQQSGVEVMQQHGWSIWAGLVFFVAILVILVIAWFVRKHSTVIGHALTLLQIK